jgi:uncharacterized protein
MILTVRVKLRARHSEVRQISQDEYEVRLTQLPIKGKANDELRNVLANYFSCRVWQVSIVAGHASRVKMVRVPDFA